MMDKKISVIPVLKTAAVLFSLLFVLDILLPSASIWAEDDDRTIGVRQIFQKTGRVLILPPYNMSETYGVNTTVSGPLSGKVFPTEEVAPEASDYLYPKIIQFFSELDKVSVVYFKATESDAAAGLEPATDHRTDRLVRLQKLGKDNGADAVLCTYIYIFQERIGKDYGVERPAKISLEMNMVGVDTGAVVWQTDIAETQQALNENLLKIGSFLQRGGRWITAREMAVNAIEDAIKKFEKDYLTSPQTNSLNSLEIDQ